MSMKDKVIKLIEAKKLFVGSTNDDLQEEIAQLHREKVIKEVTAEMLARRMIHTELQWDETEKMWMVIAVLETNSLHKYLDGNL